MATGQVLFQRFFYTKSFVKHSMEVRVFWYFLPAEIRGGEPRVCCFGAWSAVPEGLGS